MTTFNQYEVYNELYCPIVPSLILFCNAPKTRSTTNIFVLGDWGGKGAKMLCCPGRGLWEWWPSPFEGFSLNGRCLEAKRYYIWQLLKHCLRLFIWQYLGFTAQTCYIFMHCMLGFQYIWQHLSQRQNSDQCWFHM